MTESFIYNLVFSSKNCLSKKISVYSCLFLLKNGMAAFNGVIKLDIIIDIESIIIVFFNGYHLEPMSPHILR